MLFRSEPINHIETARDLMADAATEIEALRDEVYSVTQANEGIKEANQRLRDQNHVYHAEIGRLKDMIELLYKASK